MLTTPLPLGLAAPTAHELVRKSAFLTPCLATPWSAECELGPWFFYSELIVIIDL